MDRFSIITTVRIIRYSRENSIVPIIILSTTGNPYSNQTHVLLNTIFRHVVMLVSEVLAKDQNFWNDTLAVYTGGHQRNYREIA